MSHAQKSQPACPLPPNAELLLIPAKPFLGSLTFQHFILFIAAGCSAVTLFLSLWLIIKHLHRYSCPKEQRQIIRIIFTPVVYAVLSTVSMISYANAKYISPFDDLYEAFALASLFLLFVEYVAPDESTRSRYFHNLELRTRKGTTLPGGCLKWFQWNWIMVFTFPFVMIILTIAQEVSQAVGTYCATSLSPRFVHIWITVISSVTVSVAVFAVLKLYKRLKPEIREHKPLQKLLSLKLMVFINFLQTIIFSVLSGKGVLKGNSTHTITMADMAVGIPNLLTAVEQVMFAIFFHYAFRSREYHSEMKTSARRMGTLRAAAHAFNPTDMIVAIFTAFKYLFGGKPSPSSFSDMNVVPKWEASGDSSTQLNSGLEPTRTGNWPQQPFETPRPYAEDNLEYQGGRSRQNSPPHYETSRFLSANGHEQVPSRDPSFELSRDAVSARDVV